MREFPLLTTVESCYKSQDVTNSTDPRRPFFNSMIHPNVHQYSTATVNWSHLRNNVINWYSFVIWKSAHVLVSAILIYFNKTWEPFSLRPQRALKFGPFAIVPKTHNLNTRRDFKSQRWKFDGNVNSFHCLNFFILSVT